jgi:hypothetical protein
LRVEPTEYDWIAATQKPITSGADVTLQPPPQGGFVLFLGARVSGLGEETVQLAGRLHEGARIVTQDERLSMLVRDGESWIPDLRSFTNVANVPVCPQITSTPLYDRGYDLEIEVTEWKSKRAARARIPVTLRCPMADAARCMCVCGPDYMPAVCGP